MKKRPYAEKAKAFAATVTAAFALNLPFSTEAGAQTTLKGYADRIANYTSSIFLVKRNTPASIVLDANTGTVLSEYKADEARYPASVTKIMTLFIAFDQIRAGKLKLTDQITVSSYAATAPQTSLDLKPGEKIMVETAILGMISRSGNDAAIALGEHIAGSETAFAAMMNEKAKALGMKNTTFVNAAGLPHEKQLTTARDLATLSRALISEHPDYYPYFNTRAMAFKGMTYNNFTFYNNAYAGMDGIKSGWIGASDHNLAASAVRKGRRLIAVSLGERTPADRNAKITRLLDEGFSLATRLIPEPLVAGIPEPLVASVPEPLVLKQSFDAAVTEDFATADIEDTQPVFPAETPAPPSPPEPM